jgi:hypothetical protein
MLTIATSQTEMVRHGWRLLERARVSGLSFMVDLPRAYRPTLTPYVDAVS